MNKKIFLPILLLFVLFGCGHPITAIQIPGAKPTLLGIWEHDEENLTIEFESGTYIVSYVSLDGYGEWKYVSDELINTIDVRDTLCGYANWGRYTYRFTNTGMYMLGNDEGCRGRLDRWNGFWTRIVAGE